jgi:hypothetical protein
LEQIICQSIIKAFSKARNRLSLIDPKKHGIVGQRNKASRMIESRPPVKHHRLRQHKDGWQPLTMSA